MAESEKKAAALGIFDGVHIGHRRVIGCTKERGMKPMVLTFRSKSLVQKQGRSLEYIYTDANKERIIEKLGVSDIVSEDFEKLRPLTGEEFVRDVLVRRFAVGTAVCGGDFRFGTGASCGVNELITLGKKYGIDVVVAQDAEIEGEKVSSSGIRELIRSGKVRAAAELLGESYSIYGEVVGGAQLGRTIGYPTINQIFEEQQLVPAYGVYASRTEVDGTVYPSMTNIGVKPTVGYGGAPLAETYIDGFSGDLYGKKLCVELIEYIRGERKFPSVEALRAQIDADVRRCRELSP